MFACDGGDIVLQYNDGSFLVIDLDDNETKCTRDSSDFCRTYESPEYCPRINYCDVPSR